VADDKVDVAFGFSSVSPVYLHACYFSELVVERPATKGSTTTKACIMGKAFSKPPTAIFIRYPDCELPG